MWYALQVTVGREDELCQKCKKAFLGKEATDVFVPKYVWMKKVKGVRKKEVSPLFYGYIFVESTTPKSLEKHLEIFQDVKPVFIRGEFCPLEREEEDFLRHFLGKEKTVSFSIGYLVDGELRVVNGGILKKFTEKIRKIDRHKRLAEVEASLFGETRRILAGLEVKGKITAEQFEKMKKLKEIKELEERKN